MGVHHGIIVMGIAHALKVLPSLLVSLMLFADAEEQEGK